MALRSLSLQGSESLTAGEQVCMSLQGKSVTPTPRRSHVKGVDLVFEPVQENCFHCSNRFGRKLGSTYLSVSEGGGPRVARKPCHPDPHTGTKLNCTAPLSANFACSLNLRNPCILPCVCFSFNSAFPPLEPMSTKEKSARTQVR